MTATPDLTTRELVSGGRGGDFIVARDEITHVAYEFTTGTGWPTRLERSASSRR